MVTLLFTMTSIEVAPRMGLGIAALLTLVAGIISMLRVGGGTDIAPRETASASPHI